MHPATTTVIIAVEGRCSAICHTYPDHGPILSVSTPGGHLSLSGSGHWVASEEEVAFARELQAATTTYRQEVEAFASRVDTSPEPVVGGDPA